MVTTNAQTSKEQIVLNQLALDALLSLPDSISNAVRALAIPHFFNLEITQILLEANKDDAENVFQRIIELPYIQPYSQSEFVIFPLVRNVILENWSTNLSLYDEYHKRLATYFTKLSEADNGWVNPARIEAIFVSSQ